MGGSGDQPSATILHVSDPQFGEHHRFEDGSLGRHLISDLRHLTGTVGVARPDLVIVSGDIAEKGMRAEYAQARAFIDASAPTSAST